MPAQYIALKKEHGPEKAARIYIGMGKTKAARSKRAKSLRHYGVKRKRKKRIGMKK